MSVLKARSIIGRALISILPVIAVAVLGNVATIPSIPGWYASLSKPPGTPPNWLFGPVWTLLYCAMIIAVWRVLSLPEHTPGRTKALHTFFVQLAFNCAWSWAFFAVRSPLLGLIVIACLLAAIVLTVQSFCELDQVASWLLAPYLLWVIYAAWLNFGICWLNSRGQSGVDPVPWTP